MAALRAMTLEAEVFSPSKDEFLSGDPTWPNADARDGFSSSSFCCPRKDKLHLEGLALEGEPYLLVASGVPVPLLWAENRVCKHMIISPAIANEQNHGNNIPPHRSETCAWLSPVG